MALNGADAMIGSSSEEQEQEEEQEEKGQ